MTTPADPGGAPAPAAATVDPAAAAAAPNPNPAAAPGGAAPAGQAPGAAGDPSPAYRPEGLPDHLYGATDKETVEKLFKAYAPAREAIAKFGSVPDAPEKYAFTPAETVAPWLPNVAEDPAFKAAQTAAHKHGLGDKQFAGFVNDFMAGLVAGGQLDDPFSADKERAIIAPDVQDPGERAKAADRASRDVVAFIDALQAQGKIDQGTADFAKGRSDRGHFVKFVNALRAGAPGLEVGGQHAAAGQSMATLDARIADPKNKWGSPTYDPVFAAETKRMAQQLIGDGDPGRA
jgi:cytochrome c1